MIDTSISSTSIFGSSLRERQLSVENDALARSNQQLQGENRDLRTQQQRLEAENGDLQRSITDLERQVSRSAQSTDAGSSGSLLDVYA